MILDTFHHLEGWHNIQALLHGLFLQHFFLEKPRPYEGLLPIACWDCGFESRRGHGCLSVVSVVCCQVVVSATG